MKKMRLMLPGLLACLFATYAFAQINVDVRISGIDTLVEENVRQFLSLEQQKNHSLMSEGRLRRLHKKAPQEITLALQPFGYYRPEITTELKRLAPEQWQADYTIDPGPAIQIAEFDLSISSEMEQDSEFQKLLQNFPLRKGDVFNHTHYETIKSSLVKLASERGYINARFTQHQVDINLATYEVHIHLHYDGGSRYRFGEVLLKQDVLDEELLRRYIPFEIGSPYDLNELINLQHALNDSDYFRTVEVSPVQPQINQHEIPVNVALSPRKRHRYTLGLGYGNDTGARMKAGWEMPRLNTAGHRLGTEVRLSEIGYSLSANYRVPVLNPRTDQMVYSVGVINETTDTSESTLRTVGASLNRSHGAWRESFSLNYQQEDYVIAGTEGDSVLLLPGVSWSRTWGDDFINTFDGLRFDISLRGASKQLISDTGFTQLQAGIKAINSLNQHDRIITRGRIGSTWTGQFDQLPSSVRFFAGGAQSVRGYAYQSLGQVDVDGKVIGGRHLMIGSIEYEHSFDGKSGIALFYDAGNAIDDFADSLERGVGFGYRWKSPVGPVRIDLARANSQHGKPWRLHINIGPDL